MSFHSKLFQIVCAVPAILIMLLGFPAVEARAADDLETRIDSLAEPLIEHGYTVGIVVALIENGNTRVFGYGKPSAQSDRKPDAQTIFEIGSVTKLFTALALADMVQRGKVSLEDPVEKYLPDNIKVPAHENRKITLEDLATHTSGLPRIPPNFNPKDPANPYADYTAEKLYDFLSSYTLPRSPGGEHEYSNLGSGLLGHALARREGIEYEALIVDGICRPLGMKDTGIRIGPDRRPRLARGHNLDSEPVRAWDFDVLAGCGALRSTANDMAAFVTAGMGTAQSPLSSAIAMTQILRGPSAVPGYRIGLGWHCGADGKICWHNGGTFGFYSFVGFNKERGIGIVWLSNSALWQVKEVNAGLLDILSGKPVERLKLKTPVILEPAVLDRYVGEYRPAPNVVLKVSREGHCLVLEPPGGEKTVFHAESDSRFFLKETTEITMSFEKDEKGNVTRLVAHRKDGDKPADRVK